MSLLNDLAKGVVENLEILRKNGVIDAKVISDYSEMVERNLHSWLQYSVIDAARGWIQSALQKLNYVFHNLQIR